MKSPPFVAGAFYDLNKDDLLKRLEWCFSDNRIGPGVLPEKPTNKLEKNVGAIVPHAGYIYSGPVAAWAYLELSKLGKPDTVILIGPNHTGAGAEIGVWPEGVWQTPLGELKVAKDVVETLLGSSVNLMPDTASHIGEHSLEVQLPFLQYIYGNDFEIVPITMMIQSLEFSEVLSESIKKVFERFPERKFVIIASTDLNHYESQEITVKKDEKFIKAVISEDPKKVVKAVKENDITACGFGPVSVVLKLKLGKPKLLKHATSGDTSGDLTHVVGYASFIVS
ncbi:MAG: hypothetical protein PWQ48_831 [Thermotogaceae bacterium]|nr:hypothetical protein [Thermotogaceae bacterium]